MWQAVARVGEEAMFVYLGAAGHTAQGQLEGFKARALRGAPVRAARDLYVTEWRQAETDRPKHAADGNGCTEHALGVLGLSEAHRGAALHPGIVEALLLKAGTLSRWSALVIASPAPAAMPYALARK